MRLRSPVSPPVTVAVCPRCQSDELVRHKQAGRYEVPENGGPARFVETRAEVSCAHCFTMFSARVDGRVAFELRPVGRDAGPSGLIARTHEAAPGAEEEPEPERPETVPDAVEDLVEHLRSRPGARMG